MTYLGKSIGADVSENNGGAEKKNVVQKQTIQVPKNKDNHEDSGYQKTFQNILNELIDLKKLLSINSSMKKVFRLSKNNNKSQPQQLAFPPPLIQGLNIEEGRMGNYCRAHKENHSKITFQVFINLFGSPAQSSNQEMVQPTIMELKGDTEDEG